MEKEREKKLGKQSTLLQEVPINTVFQSAAFKYATNDDHDGDKQLIPNYKIHQHKASPDHINKYSKQTHEIKSSQKENLNKKVGKKKREN